jgi:hypothetical protein
LIDEDAAVGGGEEVVEVAQPDGARRQGGAGDFVGAHTGGEAGGAQRGQVAGVGREKVKARQAGLAVAARQVVQEATALARAVEDLVDAVLALGAEVPGGQSRRLRLRRFMIGWCPQHFLQGGEHVELSGGFAGEVNHAVGAARAQGGEGGLEQHAGLAVAGGRGEHERGGGGAVRGGREGGRELGEDGFLARARRGEGGLPGEGAQAGEGGAAFLEKLGRDLEMGQGRGVVGVGEGDDLLQTGAGLDEDEFAASAGGGGRGGGGGGGDGGCGGGRQLV